MVEQVDGVGDDERLLIDTCTRRLWELHWSFCSAGVSASLMRQYRRLDDVDFFEKPAANSSMSLNMPGSIQSSGSRMAIHSPCASFRPRLHVAP